MIHIAVLGWLWLALYWIGLRRVKRMYRWLVLMMWFSLLDIVRYIWVGLSVGLNFLRTLTFRSIVHSASHSLVPSCLSCLCRLFREEPVGEWRHPGLHEDGNVEVGGSNAMERGNEKRKILKEGDTLLVYAHIPTHRYPLTRKSGVHCVPLLSLSSLFFYFRA